MTSTLPPLPYPDADELVDHWWWRPGWQVGTRFYAWHITVNDLPGLRDLVRTYQQALAEFPTLDLIPAQWMHITVQGVGHTRDVPDAERDAIMDAVGARLAEIPAPTLIFHRPVLHREAVVIPPTDPEPLRAIRTAIRAGIGDALGSDRVPDAPDGFRPHVSAAYVNAPEDPIAVRAALDACSANAVQVTITHASLIEMHRDHRMYEWKSAQQRLLARADGRRD
jgi:2'-5' RNA ligase